MNRQALEQHWNEVRASLVPLRCLLTGNSSAEEIFDEFVDRNELGLALHTVCDILLEREGHAIEEGDIAVIASLHERMQIKDGCVAAIRRHHSRLS